MQDKFEIDDATIEKDVQETIARMPEVSAHFVSPNTEENSHGNIREEAAPTDSTKADTGELDSAGVAWSAEQHSASRAKNSRGEWRRRRKSRVVTGQSAAPITGQVLPLTGEQIDAAKANGLMIAEAEIIICRALFGRDDWKPDDSEREQLVGAWQQCAVACRWYKTHPLIMPITATVVYAVPRLSKPETQSRLQRARTWFDARVANWREKRAKAEAKKPNAPKPVEFE